MKALLNKLNRTDNFYLSAFFGFIIACWVFGVRFLRPRLPQDIPLDLTLLLLLIVVGTCITFLFVIKIIIRPPKSSLLSEILMPLYKPIQQFNYLIANNSYFELLVFYSLKSLYPFLKTNFYSWIRNKLYTIFFIFPRTLLLLIFYVDVLYFHKLDIMYYFIWLSLISFLASYWYGAIERLRKRYIYWLDQSYEIDAITIDGDPDRSLDPAVYITRDGEEGGFTTQGFLDCLFYDIKNLKYKCIIKEALLSKMYLHIWDHYHLTEEQRYHLEIDFHNNLPAVIVADFFAQKYKSTVDFYKNEIKDINILFYTSYFLIWLYILIVSIPSFHVTSMEWIFLENFQDMMNPFSDINQEIKPG